jgi:hypothetical protein
MAMLSKKPIRGATIIPTSKPYDATGEQERHFH